MDLNKKLLILLLFILSSCQKLEWNNPFDSKCPKEIWTPTDFKAVQEGTTVKLTWTQPINQISGFKVQKAIEGGTATSLQDQTKGTVQLVDNGLTGGKVHHYSITAYAGSNNSNTVTVQVTPILNAGITTTDVSAVTNNSISTGGNITTDGGAAIIARGVCWSNNQNPTIADSKTTDGTGSGAFTSSIAGLIPGATYYIRAYAINTIGTSYGNQVSIATTANLPSLTTTTVSAVTTATASSGGVISSDGGSAITARGVCWSTTVNPTISNSKTTDANGIGTYVSSITGLSSANTYYVRAYASNSAGTAYGQQEICVSSYGTVADVDGNTYQTVKIGSQIWTRENLKTTKYNDGIVIPLVTDNTTWANLATPGYCWYNNDATIYKNLYGALYNWFTVSTNKLCPTGWHIASYNEMTTLITMLGGGTIAGGKLKETGTSHWVSPNVGATNETGFTALPSGYRSYLGAFGNIGFYDYLWSSTENSATLAWNGGMYHNASDYYFGSNSSWKQYGFSVRCISGELTPSSITTSSISNITSAAAVSGGSINSDGGAPVTARGVCWSTTQNPTIANSKTTDGTGTGIFTSSITGLFAGTTYYVRAYVTNSAGTAYGSEVSFSTTLASGGTVTDVDGNVYNTVTIGTQVWMTENLKTTKYNDGTSIANITDNTAWGTSTTGAYCFYNNDAAINKATYGALYNWYAVSTNKLAPSGWHVPTDAEWTTLISFLGGIDIAGIKLKEAGIVHWDSPNSGSTNSSGFSALPGGSRSNIFGYLGYIGNWWNITEQDAGNAKYRAVWTDQQGVHQSYASKSFGFSVRCILGTLNIPSISTSTLSNITSSSATCGGNITNDGGTAVIAKGVCWSTSASPTIANSKTSDGTGIGSFTSTIAGLTAGTTYYLRAYATNVAGTAYGSQVSFNTTAISGNTVTDVDGNVYNTVVIGTQTWLTENLRTTKYNDGTAIATATMAMGDPLLFQWIGTNDGTYAWYAFDQSYKNSYGAIYNWNAVGTGKLCPTGWHVPSDDEWITMTNFLGGENIAGNVMKSISGWDSNGNGSNLSGFTALPVEGISCNGGSRYPYGWGGAWWSSTLNSADNNVAWYRLIIYNSSKVNRNYELKAQGWGVRCVKD